MFQFFFSMLIGNEEENTYSLCSLNDDGFIAGFLRDQYVGSKPLPAAFHRRFSVHNAADDHELAIGRPRFVRAIGGTIGGEDQAEIGDSDGRRFAELSEGGGGGGEL